MSDINVTPFVDVMLVLLIVFMVAAPLLTVGVKVDLPRTSAGPVQDQTEPLSVTVDAECALYLQEDPIGRDEVVPRLIAISENGYDKPIFLRADKTVAYGCVAEVMALLSSSGFARIVLVNDAAPKAPQLRGGG